MVPHAKLICTTREMFTATDIGNFLACRHLVTLEREAAAGNLKKPFFSDPSPDLLRELGIEHERQHLRRLKEEAGADVAEIPAGISWARAVALTAAALRAGAAVVYQAALQSADGEWGGRADFLIRVDRPSALGFWSYEAVETKLARSTKAPALIQLSLYSELLQSIQGIEPERMHLVLRRPVVRGQWSVVSCGTKADAVTVPDCRRKFRAR